MKNLRHTVVIAAVAFAAVACGNAVSAGGEAAPLPVALLTCPDHADPGSPFVVDGSATGDPSEFSDVQLTLEPGHQAATSLKSTFHVDTAALVTVRLVVTDKAKNVAEARCRFAVGDPNAQPGLPPSDPPPSDPPPSTDPDPTTPPPPPADAVDLTGTFALVAYDRPKMGGLLLYPATQCGEAPMVSLVDVQQTGNHVSMSLTYCSLTMPNVQIDAFGYQTIEGTTVPSELVTALPTLGPIDFDLDTPEPGARFAPPLEQIGVASIAGANLTDPNGALPTDPTDPQVANSDGDQDPGVSIHDVDMNDPSTIYTDDIVYRRYIRAFSGTIKSADEIDGDTLGDFRAEGNTSLLSPFGLFVPSGQGLPSTFKMSRVNTATTCDDVRAQVDSYIASLPSPGAPQDCPEF